MYVFFAIIMAAALVSCPFEEEIDDPGTRPVLESDQRPPMDPNWYKAASYFTIVDKTSNNVNNSDVGAGMEVTNVVIAWEYREANHFRVYRNGEFVGSVNGSKFEDYDLTPGQTYIYQVVQHNVEMGNGFVTSIPLEVKPFVTATPVNWRHNFISDSRTTVTSGGGSGTSGIRGSDGRYYQFRTQSSGSGANSYHYFQYQVSATGTGSWGSWTDLPAEPGGTNRLQIGTWQGNINGNPEHIAYIEGDMWDHNASGNGGIALEGQHWYDLHEQEKRVLVAHRKSSGNYNLAHLIIVQCFINVDDDGTASPYVEMTYSGRPYGRQSRDQRAVFIDGAPYALCSALNAQNWFRLGDDWREPIEHSQVDLYNNTGDQRETPDLVRIGPNLFFGSSRQNGWYPSQTTIGVGSTVEGTWSPLINVGDANGFGAQFNRFETYRMNNGEFAVAIRSYRWQSNYSGIATASGNPQRIAMLVSNGPFMASEFFPNVAFHPDHGLIGIRAGRLVSLGKPVTLTSGGTHAEGASVQAVVDGSIERGTRRWIPTTTLSTTNGVFVIDLETQHKLNGMALHAHTGYGSDGSYQFTLHGSNDNATWTQITLSTGGSTHNTASNGWPGFTPLDIATNNEYRYVRFTLTGVINSRNNNATLNNWPFGMGIYQLALYGFPAE